MTGMITTSNYVDMKIPHPYQQPNRMRKEHSTVG